MAPEFRCGATGDVMSAHPLYRSKSRNRRNSGWHSLALLGSISGMVQEEGTVQPTRTVPSSCTVPHKRDNHVPTGSALAKRCCVRLGISAILLVHGSGRGLHNRKSRPCWDLSLLSECSQRAKSGSGWQLFFEALCHFARDFLRGSSSRIAMDRCESEVNLIVHRERPRDRRRDEPGPPGDGQ